MFLNKSYSVELFPSVLNQSKFSLKLVSGSTNSTIQKDVFLKNDLKQKERYSEKATKPHF